MQEDIFEILIEFVIRESAVDDEEILRDTKLETDLGLSGDDATEFIVKYGKMFNVDVSQFMAADYFHPEGDFILPALTRFFTGKSKPPVRILTVGDLEKGIIAGRLDDVVINS